MTIFSKEEELDRIEKTLWLVREAAGMFVDCECTKLACSECPAGVIWETAEDGTERSLCDCITDLLNRAKS